MSLSINRNLITTSYDYSTTAKSNENNAQNATNQKTTDSLELSKAFAELMGGWQMPMPTENYTNMFMQDQDQEGTELTSDQQKSFLTNLQSVLTSSKANNQTESDNVTNPLASVSELLSSQDFAEITDDEVSDLFDQVTEILQNQRPEPPGRKDQALQAQGGQSSLPPMMQAMGGIMPPFAWNIQESSTEESDDESVSTTATSTSTLTSDEKRALLGELQRLLTTTSESDTSETSDDQGQDLLSILKNFLSETDAFNAEDEELASLFETI